jgi:hypothetical protein
LGLEVKGYPPAPHERMFDVYQTANGTVEVRAGLWVREVCDVSKTNIGLWITADSATSTDWETKSEPVSGITQAGYIILTLDSATAPTKATASFTATLPATAVHGTVYVLAYIFYGSTAINGVVPIHQGGIIQQTYALVDSVQTYSPLPANSYASIGHIPSGDGIGALELYNFHDSTKTATGGFHSWVRRDYIALTGQWRLSYSGMNDQCLEIAGSDTTSLEIKGWFSATSAAIADDDLLVSKSSDPAGYPKYTSASDFLDYISTNITKTDWMSYLQLSDTDDGTYADKAGYVPVVNVGENGLILTDITAGIVPHTGLDFTGSGSVGVGNSGGNTDHDDSYWHAYNDGSGVVGHGNFVDDHSYHTTGDVWGSELHASFGVYVGSSQYWIAAGMNVDVTGAITLDAGTALTLNAVAASTWTFTDKVDWTVGKTSAWAFSENWNVTVTGTSSAWSMSLAWTFNILDFNASGATKRISLGTAGSPLTTLSFNGSDGVSIANWTTKGGLTGTGVTAMTIQVPDGSGGTKDIEVLARAL